MSDCRDLEPWFAPYVDGDGDFEARAAVDAHLERCPACRTHVAETRAARDVLVARRQGLAVPAPEHLKQRCAGHCAAAAGAESPARVTKVRTWVPLSLAASLILAIAAIFVFGFNDSVEVLAAQLAVDHVKCFQFPPDGHTHVDAAELGREWAKERGWAFTIPPSAPAQDLVLLGVRRCISTSGLTAHVMYRWRDQPLSVYVLNGQSIEGGQKFVEKLGQDAVIWSGEGRTYAVVARGAPQTLEPVVAYVKSITE